MQLLTLNQFRQAPVGAMCLNGAFCVHPRVFGLVLRERIAASAIETYKLAFEAPAIEPAATFVADLTDVTGIEVAAYPRLLRLVRETLRENPRSLRAISVVLP